MIKERKGNLLQADAPMIAHQVNCQGVMGAGNRQTDPGKSLNCRPVSGISAALQKEQGSPSWRLLSDAAEGFAALCGTSVCREYSHRQKIRYRLCSTETEPDCHDVPGSTAGIIADCHSRLSGMRACRR